MARGSRRSRIAPPTDPDQRIQQRLGNVEAAPPPWRTTQGGESGLRIVRGIGSGGGAVTAGGGWSVSRFAAGVYVITFTTAFSAAPSVCVNALDGSYATFAIVQNSVSTTGCQIQTGVSGTNTDKPYNFIAIGPA